MRLIQRIIQNKVLYPFAGAVKSIKDKGMREKIWNIKHNKDEVVFEHLGDENPQRIVYEIYVNDGASGFFALMRYVCTALFYAYNRGFIPYVLLGKKCRYYDAEVIETDNIFEYYFKPVSYLTYESVRNSQNVLFYEVKHLTEIKSEKSFQLVPEIVSSFSKVWREYIHLNETTYEKLNNDISDILCEDKKTIGVHVRGTDFKQNYNGHPIAITAEEELLIVKELISTKNYEQIFLATDEESTIRLFREQFGDMVKCFTDTFRSTDGSAVHGSENNRSRHKYLLGYEVLRDVYTLAQCQGLVAGVSNVSFFATVINQAGFKEYEDLKISYHGMNHNAKNYTEGR